MTQIKITQGLDIPIKGGPTGQVQSIWANGHNLRPASIGLNLSPFQEEKFRLLVKAEDSVVIGQPLLESKTHEGLFFASPAAGTIKDIRRGHKRILEEIIIELSPDETYQEFTPLSLETASRDQIIEQLKAGGLFPYIRQRPFNRLANPTLTPRSIFVKALESAPFAVSAEMQVEGREKEFQAGLLALSKLTSGKVHLVYRKDSPCRAFTEAQQVEKHTAEGPHPIANHSVHIHQIDPITKVNDVVWTLNAAEVVYLGAFLTTGKYFIERIISIAGPGILPERRGFFKARAGYPVESLIAGRIERGVLRFISGDVLTGTKVSVKEYLNFYDHAFCVFPESTERQLLHFFRLGTDKYTATGAYLSGHLDNRDREYDFTTSLHGERRAFVTSDPYRKVMPMKIPTMELVKAVMAEDYDLAEILGLLEVDGEDFALPTFIDPSKIEMVEIINHGLKRHAAEV